MTQDEFQAHETARYQRVMKKLESATVSTSTLVQAIDLVRFNLKVTVRTSIA